MQQSFTANFRTKNAQLFSDTSWVDLDDLRAWIRGRGDLDHLLDPPVSESNFPPVVGLGPDSLYGMDGSVGNTTFNTYPAVNFDRPRSATPSSGYSFHPYDDHQSSNHSRPSSEFEYLSASGISTPYSGLPLFGDNVSEPNLDWDHSLAAFLTRWIQAVASGSDMFCFHQNASHVVALNPTAFLPPPQEPQENFKFEDGNPRLMTHEEMDEAGEAWQWVRSDTVWLDQDVSCDVYIPPEPFPVTKGFKVVRIERVHGIPSQFPVPLVPTAYIVDFSSVRDSYKNEDGEMNNLDKILKDKDCHSWDGTPGERTSSRAPMVHGQLFASIGNCTFVQCRWSRQNCQGIHYCESIDPSLINVERFELDPHARDAVNNAQIMQRLNQGMKCTAKNVSGGACGGYKVLKQAELPSRRKYYFACSNYSSSWKNHSGIQIPPDVDEDLCIRLFRGDSIVGGALESTFESCSRIMGSGSGRKGKSQCHESFRKIIRVAYIAPAFSHSKDGKAYIASMLKLICAAGTTFLVPLDEENVPVVIVIPQHNRPHTHPPPPDTKVPGHVKALYEQAIRAFGVSIATVNKVDQGNSSSDTNPSCIHHSYHGSSPGIGSPFAAACNNKQAIISALKRREPGGDKSGWEGLFDIYKADQEKDPRERYMHSFDFLPGRSPPSAVITTFEHVLLDLDQDTTFKRMKAGLLNEYELTAFFAPLNRLFTFGRIYMDAKDADAFEFAWDKIDEAFFGATGKHLAFKAWDPDGWLVTVSGDMEAAPWIGMAQSFIKCMDIYKRPTVDEFLVKVLRICRRHALEGLRHSVKPHVDDDQWTRFQGFLALKTREEIQEFSDWFFSLDIKPITVWWNHKLNHKWILPGLLECLSGLSHEDWITTPFTSNGNETQHHWTNSQTGIGLPARECILRAAKADHAVGEQFEASLASGIMANNRLSHCTARNAKCHTSAVEKAKRSNAGNHKVKELKAELTILMAEMKTSSSGVVRVTQKSKAKSLGITPLSSIPYRRSRAFIAAKDAAARNKAPKKRSIDERELDGIQMSSPDVRIETGVQSDAFEQENDGDASQYEPAIPMILDAVDDGMILSFPTHPSPISPHSEPPAPLSIRRSSRKRGASKTHDDAPAPKSKKTEGAAAAPEASNSGKTRRVACPHS
ncbi:hypothetical protein B0H10DRAFT_2305409 [Mycena sp. CBHHK59/15]|nr:hypothetical protein B0H10DRAFT_2305409 [Mycena sp. CBHHK59/15]